MSDHNHELRNTTGVISAVKHRLKLIAVARTTYRAWWWLAVVCIILITVSKTTGWASEYINLYLGSAMVFAFATLALIFGYAFHHRIDAKHSATQIDNHMGTKDLFLTAQELSDQQKEQQATNRKGFAFSPLVLKDAEMSASEVSASQVVPMKPWEKGTKFAMMGGVLIALVTFVPQFDVLGERAVAAKQEETQKEITKEVKKAEKRERELAQKKLDQALSDETLAKLQALQIDLEGMKPSQREKNRQKLAKHQAELDQAWKELKKANVKALRSSGNRFGGKLNKEMATMLKALEEGNTEPVEAELDNMAKLAQQIMNEQDPIKKQQQKDELKKKITQMSMVMKRSGNNTAPVAKALQSALNNLNKSDKQGMNKAAMQAAAKQLGLSQQEVKALQQRMNDMAAIKQAMRTTQMAQQVNQQQPLDGQQMASQCKSGGGKQGSQGSQGSQQQKSGGSQQQKSGSQQQQQANQGNQGSKSGMSGMPAQGSGLGRGQSSNSQSGGKGSAQRAVTQPGNGSCGSCQAALMDYAKWYHQQLKFKNSGGGSGSGMGGSGSGMGGPGRGRGGKAQYDPSVQTGMKKEMDVSPFVQGSILHSEKTNEDAPVGEIVKGYRPAAKDVMQDVSEAIERQDIPPGYEKAIMSYFEDMQDDEGDAVSDGGAEAVGSESGEVGSN